MNTGIKIGNNMGKGDFAEIADAIVRTMEARADQETIRAGLEAFGHMSEVKNLNFDSISVVGDTFVSGSENTQSKWAADQEDQG